MTKPIKIFVTGADGQLAKAFREIYPDKHLHLTGKGRLDITNKREVGKQIKEVNPDIVLHFASMTRGDDNAKNPTDAHKINVIGTKNVVEAVAKNNCEFLFISTNEVFDGKKKSAYTERDHPHPITVVGKNKYIAEKIIQKKLNKYYIVRTSWLFSRWSDNFLKIVIKKAKSTKKINLVNDEISSPTFSNDLAKAIKKLIMTKKYGIYHIANSGMASRYEFAKFAFEVCKLKNIKINAISLSEFARLSTPPKFTPLTSMKLAKLGIKMPTWKSSLKKFLVSQTFKL